MKKHLLILSLLITVKAFAQELNYCNYFTLEVAVIEDDGEFSKVVSPTIIEHKNDAFSKFLNKHNNRFQYILFKDPSQFGDFAKFYPDDEKIQNEYCQQVVNSTQIKSYFSALTPKNLVTWNAKADTFSIDELMLVASKFFFCDAINKEDTTIQTHVCIGINGQDEYKSDRDLTVLEAFTFEAIFSYLNKRKVPLFYAEFELFKNKTTKEKTTEFNDFDSFLIDIRKLCYKEMQSNKDLKTKLLNYYHKNVDNLNFVIR